MKKIPFLLIYLPFFSLAFAESNKQFICSYIYSKNVIKKAESHSSNDKNKHCSVSCMLTLRCPATEVMAVGALKEFKDLFDSGNAEVADLIADRRGIIFVLNSQANTDTECFLECDKFYY